MIRGRAFVAGLLALAGMAAFALPPAYLDSSRSGALEAGLLLSVDPRSGKTGIGVDFYWISRARVGVGVSSMFSLRHFPETERLTLDGLYYLDFASSGEGFAVMPIVARVGAFGDAWSFGYGLATGLEWYAVPFAYDGNDDMYISSQPRNCDTFLALKGLGEIDYVRGLWHPSFVLGVDFAETVGGKSGQGYSN